MNDQTVLFQKILFSKSKQFFLYTIICLNTVFFHTVKYKNSSISNNSIQRNYNLYVYSSNSNTSV